MRATPSITLLDATGDDSALAGLRRAAANAQNGVGRLLAARDGRALLRQALTIRAVENTLLGLFGKGRLHGTIHTCVGQEFSGVMVGQALAEGDFVTSNHRCHGHFIAATGAWRGLIDEIAGNARGVSAGVGSSQHLYAPNFLSNGQQGGLLPVAAGIALDRKRRESAAGKGAVVVSFIGEGTLGEGIVYETLNIDALWSLPHLVVCENNAYSQSTPQNRSVAGDILARPRAFGIKTFEADTWDPLTLRQRVREAFSYIRTTRRPAFLLVRTYRLNPHSKGDDDRDSEERAWFAGQDPVTLALAEDADLARTYEEVQAEVAAYAADALEAPTLAPEAYFRDQLPRREGADCSWTPVAGAGAEERQNQALNAFYHRYLEERPEAYFLGEDIADPYGGAFKVARGLTTAFPERALTTPISEAAIAGLGVGLAVAGNRPFVEIMFGDFMTHVMDQLVTNASKAFHMYNRAVDCPLVIRTPMGGRRGYGPTHSQSLDRFFAGIDNCALIAVNNLLPVERQLGGLAELSCPAVVIENKIDYTQRPFRPPSGFLLEESESPFPAARLRPEQGRANVTIVAHGGMARLVAEAVETLFEEADALAEVIVPTLLHPLDLAPILSSAEATGLLLVAEEGPSAYGIGAEILARVAESATRPVRMLRIGGAPVPIPSVPALEREALPDGARIAARLCEIWELEA